MLEVLRLDKSYDSPQGPFPTLKEISFSVKKGEFVSIIGPSGSGKSTLFNIISGLELPDRGEVLLEGQNITGKTGHVSYMLQKDLLLPWRTVLENCVLGLEIQGVEAKLAREKAREMLGEWDLLSFADRYPAVLSGGMRQRVAFLRTMLAGKEILLLDEPFGALDAYTKWEMHRWLLKVWEKYRPTVLFITHDVEEALILSDNIYVLSPRPASIVAQKAVPIPRPRTREIITSLEFVAIKKELLDRLFP